MGNITDIVILIFFLFEVFILVKLEKVLWGTYYTPLNFLMLPYTAVLLINISLPPSLGFVSFYYPSILVWAVGLIIFFLPSLLFGVVYLRTKTSNPIVIQAPAQLKTLYFFGVLFLLASLYYLFTKSQVSEDLIGSDEFASATLVGGFWGHVREALLSILILSIFLFQKRQIIWYLLIIGILLISIVYQVKSWILIPIVAGLVMRLLTGKSKFRIKTVLYVVIGGVAMFFLSYYLILVFAVEDGEFNTDMLEMIYKHFIFYLTSGTSSLGVDLQQGILENPNPKSIFAPFLNILSLVDGRELVSPINPVFLYIGWTAANVRTFFGTLYINLGLIGSIFYVFSLSSLLYTVLLWLKTKPNLWILSFYGLMNAFLFMGWFEFYFFHLSIIEIPFFLLIFSALMYIRIDRESIMKIVKWPSVQ